MSDRPWLRHYSPGTPHGLSYPEAPVSGFLAETAARHPEHVALVLGDLRLTYAQLAARTWALAHALLDLGVRRGDRVALLLPNTPTYVMAHYAALRIGAVVVNLSPGSQGAELERVLVDAGASTLVTLDVFLPAVYKVLAATPVERVLLHSLQGLEKKLPPPPRGVPLLPLDALLAGRPGREPDVAVTPDDLAVLQYTSGATGTPKAAMLTHRNLVASVEQARAWISTGEGDNGGVVCVIPFFHVFGMSIGLHASVAKGYRMILVPRFDTFDLVPILRVLEAERPVSLPAVPTLWAALLAAPGMTGELLSSVRVASSGGAPLPAWVQARYRALTGGTIYEAYGLSEATGAALFVPFPAGAPEGSVGVPLPDVEARIVDLETGERELGAGEIGELALRGPQVMRGYHRNEELTRNVLRDGWLRTGDLARRDDGGFFFLVDRKDDLIITSGHNVYPSEVEPLIARHPGVEDVCVTGEPDRIRGQVVIAHVVLAPGAATTVEQLLAACRADLPPEKVPREIRLAERIPRNPVGKALRRQLRG